MASKQIQNKQDREKRLAGGFHRVVKAEQVEGMLVGLSEFDVILLLHHMGKAAMLSSRTSQVGGRREGEVGFVGCLQASDTGPDS